MRYLLTALLTIAALGPARAERIVVAALEAGVDELHLRYRFEATNTTADTVSGARLLVYVPALATATQRLLWVNTSHDATLHSDALGNAWVSVALPLLPPRGTALVSITAAVAIDPGLRPGASHASALAPAPFIEVGDPLITTLAMGLVRPDAWSTARAVYELVITKVRPIGFEPRDLGAVHALGTGAGDCTEMAYAFIALARAAGLHARLAGGWVVGTSALLSPATYHNWVEVHDGTSWRVVDPHGGSFGDNAASYVATHLGGTGGDGPLAGFHRFRADHPALALRMLGAP